MLLLEPKILISIINTLNHLSDMDNNQDYQPQQPPQYQQPQYQQPPQYQQQPPQYQQQPPQYQQPYQQPYQQAYQPGQQPPMKPDNNLVWAILSTILCCLPLGIVAIVYASKVDGLYNQGDYAGAQEAADNAKKWAMWSAIISIVILVLYFIALAVFGISMGGF